MALLYVDSFDTYATADLGRRYSVINSPIIDSTEMRTGVGCLHFNSINDGIMIPFAPTDNKFVIGFSFKVSVIPSQNTNIFAFRGSSIDNLWIRINSDGTVALLRSTTVIGTSLVTITEDTWYHFELLGELANSTTIECVLKINGTVVITIPTGTDTYYQDCITAKIQKTTSSVGSLYFDSLYLMDQSGPKNNDFLGDCVVEAVHPDGNGYNSDFDGSDADKVDNYLLVDEADPDDDTTYIEDDTIGGIDSFTYTAMSGSPATIHGVAVNTMAKKTTENARTIKQVARPASTNYTGDEHTLSESYLTYQDIWEDNPEDDAAWEEADVNGSEFGVKVES